MNKLLIALLTVSMVGMLQANCPNDPYSGQYTSSVYNEPTQEKIISNGVEYKGEPIQPLVFVNESPEAKASTAPVVEEQKATIELTEPKAPEASKAEIKIEEIKTPAEDTIKVEASKIPEAVKAEEEKLLQEIKRELEKLEADEQKDRKSIFDEEVETALVK